MTNTLRLFSSLHQSDTTIVEVPQPADVAIPEVVEQPQPEPTAKPRTAKKTTIIAQDTTKAQTAADSLKQAAETTINPDVVKTKKELSPWVTIKGFTHRGDAYRLNDSLITGLSSRSNTFGVTAKPAPYTISSDNVITSLLLISFILALISVANSRRFIARQAKIFFRTPNERTTPITETTNEIRFQVFLVVLTCLLGAIIFYFYTLAYVSTSFTLSPQYLLVGIYFAIIAAYFLLKLLLYIIVNWVFFSHRQNERWLKSQLFIESIEGLLLFPIVLLLVYIELPINTTVIYTLGVIIFIKMLSFYKCYVIFFQKITAFLQIFLYFCALEIIPLAILYGFLVLTNNFLRINY